MDSQELINIGIYINGALVLANIAIVIITYEYVKITQRILKQSKDEQKIKEIERRLEKFYLPFKSVINSYSKIEYILNYHPSVFEQDPKYEEYLSDFKRDILNVFPYVYLASNDLKPLLVQFYSHFSKNYYSNKKERERTFENKTAGEKSISNLDDTIEKSNLDDDIYDALTRDKDNFIKLYEKIIKQVDEDIEKYVLFPN